MMRHSGVLQWLKKVIQVFPFTFCILYCDVDTILSRSKIWALTGVLKQSQRPVPKPSVALVVA